MATTATNVASKNLVYDGNSVTFTLTFSGAIGNPTVQNVGWIGRPPYWETLHNLIGNTVNTAQMSFSAVFEGRGSAYGTNGQLTQQPVMPFLQLSDGSVVVPQNVSSAPSVNPAYATGFNPPSVVSFPVTDATLMTSATGPNGQPGVLDFSNLLNSGLLAALSF